MPKFKVHYFKTYVTLASVEVEAEDEFDAELLADEVAETTDLDWSEMQVGEFGVDYVEELEDA